MAHIFTAATMLGGKVLDLLYPPRCGGCDEVGAGWWCPACNARVQMLDAAHNISSIPSTDGTLMNVLSTARFTPPLREGIHRFKYESQPQLAEAFGNLMSTTWLTAAWQADAFVPVPLHPSRQRERGYNQSELLSRVISRRTQVPMRNWLKRIRPTEQQAHLNAHQRVANVKAAFRAEAIVNAKHIVLVDDVLTTGATLAECAAALHQAGAANVLAITLAIAKH